HGYGQQPGREVGPRSPAQRDPARHRHRNRRDQREPGGQRRGGGGGADHPGGGVPDRDGGGEPVQDPGAVAQRPVAGRCREDPVLGGHGGEHQGPPDRTVYQRRGDQGQRRLQRQQRGPPGYVQAGGEVVAVPDGRGAGGNQSTVDWTGQRAY